MARRFFKFPNDLRIYYECFDRRSLLTNKGLITLMSRMAIYNGFC